MEGGQPQHVNTRPELSGVRLKRPLVLSDGTLLGHRPGSNPSRAPRQMTKCSASVETSAYPIAFKSANQRQSDQVEAIVLESSGPGIRSIVGLGREARPGALRSEGGGQADDSEEDRRPFGCPSPSIEGGDAQRSLIAMDACVMSVEGLRESPVAPSRLVRAA